MYANSKSSSYLIITTNVDGPYSELIQLQKLQRECGGDRTRDAIHIKNDYKEIPNDSFDFKGMLQYR